MVQNDNTKEAAFRPYFPVRTRARGWGTHYPPEISRTGVDCVSSSNAPPPTTVQSLRPNTRALSPILTKGRQCIAGEDPQDEISRA